MDQSQSTRHAYYELKTSVYTNHTYVTVELKAAGERLKTLRAFDRTLAAMEKAEEQ